MGGLVTAAQAPDTEAQRNTQAQIQHDVGLSRLESDRNQLDAQNTISNANFLDTKEQLGSQTKQTEFQKEQQTGSMASMAAASGIEGGTAENAISGVGGQYDLKLGDIASSLTAATTENATKNTLYGQMQETLNKQESFLDQALTNQRDANRTQRNVDVIGGFFGAVGEGAGLAATIL